MEYIANLISQMRMIDASRDPLPRAATSRLRLRPVRNLHRSAKTAASPMSHNTIGHLFRVTTWGESHGACDRLRHRRLPAGHSAGGRGDPGVSWTSAGPASRASPRSGASPTRCASSRACSTDDAGRQVTTGTPISLIIDNVDQRGQGLQPTSRTSSGPDTRISPIGRSTASATTGAAAAPARARRPCAWPPGPSRARSCPASRSAAALVQIGRHRIDRARWNWAEVDNNPFFSPDRRHRRDLDQVPRRDRARPAPRWAR